MSELQTGLSKWEKWLRSIQPNLIPIVLILTTVVLVPSLLNDWVNWDDEAYVLRNQIVQKFDLAAMFTTSEQVGLYHPLTLFSLALDYTLYGDQPAGFHVTNLILHLFNVWLVFWLLRRWTTSLGLAFLGALLFGIHPMHMESVVWISARKDLLSGLFILLSLRYYTQFLDFKRISWLVVATVCLLAGLLSKPIAVVVPALWLLLDLYHRREWKLNMLVEKLPGVILAAVFLIIARNGQAESESLVQTSGYSLLDGLTMGLHNLTHYFVSAIAPWKVGPFHPFPFLDKVELPSHFYWAWLALPTTGIMLFVTYRRARGIFFGLAFFIICLLPYLQIIPYGKALHADRYTYLPYLGLFFALILAGQRLIRVLPRTSLTGLYVAVGTWITVLSYLSISYQPVWKNGDTLWSYVIEQYPDHYLGYVNRAKWSQKGEYQERAEQDIALAKTYFHDFGEVHYEEGRMWEAKGRQDEAINSYNKAIEYDPKLARAWVNRGVLIAKKGNVTWAIQDFTHALELDEDYALARLNRAMAYRQLGNQEQALDDYRLVFQYDPLNATYVNHYANSLIETGEVKLALNILNQIITEKGAEAEHMYLLMRARYANGWYHEAYLDGLSAMKLGKNIPEDEWKTIEEKGRLNSAQQSAWDAIAEENMNSANKQAILDALKNVETETLEEVEMESKVKAEIDAGIIKEVKDNVERLQNRIYIGNKEADFTYYIFNEDGDTVYQHIKDGEE